MAEVERQFWHARAEFHFDPADKNPQVEHPDETFIASEKDTFRALSNYFAKLAEHASESGEVLAIMPDKDVRDRSEFIRLEIDGVLRMIPKHVLGSEIDSANQLIEANKSVKTTFIKQYGSGFNRNILTYELVTNKKKFDKTKGQKPSDFIKDIWEEERKSGVLFLDQLAVVDADLVKFLKNEYRHKDELLSDFIPSKKDRTKLEIQMVAKELTAIFAYTVLNRIFSNIRNYITRGIGVWKMVL